MPAAKYKPPDRDTAITRAQAIQPGTEVQVYAEPFSLFGPLRNEFKYPAKVLRADTLPGSEIPTGRVLVETGVVCRYSKSKVRGGTKVYQVAVIPGRPRTVAVWPWDLVVSNGGAK